MSQCVPRWDLVESLRSRSSSTAPADVPMFHYEVAELTWESRQLGMHGLGPSRVQATWEKPCASGTLESIVNQATTDALALGPWFGLERVNASAPMTVDALVPCSNRTAHVTDPLPGLQGTRVVHCSTRGWDVLNGKRARVARVPVEQGNSEHVTHDTIGFTSTSVGSRENPSSANSTSPREAGDEGNKKKGNGKSSISTKRSRAAAIHNQSERKRRDRINQRMKTLQKLVPNSSKTDKASMLDEVIDYLKQLQAQVSMMSRMNMPHMMLPIPMQQQLHKLMMAPMGMGMNSMSRPNITMPPVVPAPFMSMASWDGSGDHRLQVSPVTDSIATFLACQSQPMTMDAYSRMAAMYQQIQQPPASSSKF